MNSLVTVHRVPSAQGVAKHWISRQRSAQAEASLGLQTHTWACKGATLWNRQRWCKAGCIQRGRSRGTPASWGRRVGDRSEEGSYKWQACQGRKES